MNFCVLFLLVLISQDPYEASLFYVPANMMMYTIEYFNPVPHMQKAGRLLLPHVGSTQTPPRLTRSRAQGCNAATLYRESETVSFGAGDYVSQTTLPILRS